MTECGSPKGEGALGWFDALNSYQREHTMKQIKFKEESLGVTEHGAAPWDSAKTYPHILPDSRDHASDSAGIFDLAFNPDYSARIKSYFDGVAQHVGGKGGKSSSVALHSQIRNLRSSQACCVNVMFPLTCNKRAAFEILSPYLPGAVDVTSVDFEFIDENARDAAGERRSGSRGIGMTSFDLAIKATADAGDILMLCEWKYTENTFGPCSGFTSKSNGNKGFCRSNPAGDYVNDHDQCYLHLIGRKYWSILKQLSLDWSCLREVHGCPFSGRLNQLLRQQIMAECIRHRFRRTGRHTDVLVALIRPEKNSSVVGSGRFLKQAGGNVVEIINALFGHEALQEVSIEDIVSGMSGIRTPDMESAVSYISQRYGFQM